MDTETIVAILVVAAVIVLALVALYFVRSRRKDTGAEEAWNPGDMEDRSSDKSTAPPAAALQSSNRSTEKSGRVRDTEPAADEPDARRAPPEPAPATERESERKDGVNVNTATREQLIDVPGCGEALADRIIEHRQSHGHFKSYEDLEQVTGIGETTVEQMRPHIYFAAFEQDGGRRR